MRKLIFCDIDGTILDGSRGMNEVSEKTRYAIDQLKKDHYVIIASGRCKGLLNDNIMSLDPSGYVLCNGAYAEIGGKAIHAVYFAQEALDAIRRIVKKYDGFTIFETLDEMYVDSLTSKAFISFMHSWGAALQGFREEESREKKYQIAMIGFNDTELMKKAKEELKEYVDIADHKTLTSCDVNIKGIDKSSGVRKIIEYLGIPLEDTYCFGDAINDLEMLQSVGHPVAMGNCVKELKDYGFEMTDDVLDDGFYNYLLANKLIKEI